MRANSAKKAVFSKQVTILSPKGRNLYIIGIEGFALAGCLLLICSCMGFDIGDWPSGYVWPHNNPTANWCGPIGAFFSYYLLYYIGPGVFVLAAAPACGLAASLAGRRITQLKLRAIGLVLIVCALSASVYLIYPYSRGGFPMGNGGVLGIAMGNFLKTHTAVLGTFIVVTCAWLVGAILLADSVVLALVRWFGAGLRWIVGRIVPTWLATKRHSKVMGRIWQKLSATQRLKTHETPAVIDDSHMSLRHITEQSLGPASLSPKEPVKDRDKSPAATGASTAGKDYIPCSYDDYQLPPLELLRAPEYGFAAIQSKMVDRKARALEQLLAEFGITAQVVSAEPGPAITMYELQLTAGIKVSRISNLADDMARALGAGAVRVVAPLAGKHTIGIEAPNNQREIVSIKDLIQRAGSKPQRMQIPLFLGKSSSGEVLLTDLGFMPHLLIAGTTGSGKSVCINSIIMSVLLTKRPDEVKLVLIDPKMVEMTAFDMIPHLMCPIVTETKRAEKILEWATTKMDERYELLAEAQVRNIWSYNKLGAKEIIERFKPSTPQEEAKIPKKLPHIVIIIDELADLMMTSAKEIEAYIVRLAQKSRAIGIHLVVATQRPQATVVTGLIKSNMPARIGFRVAARMDSRIILDQNGAETLLGEGDMLFLKPGTSDLVRAQGAFVDDHEIENVTKHLKEIAEPQFHPELMQLNRIDASTITCDELFDDAVRIVLESKRGSVSLLQRRLSVGYARASRIIEMMAVSGILGEYKGSQAREVTMTITEYEHIQKRTETDRLAGFTDLTEDDDQPEDEYVDTIESEQEIVTAGPDAD